MNAAHRYLGALDALIDPREQVAKQEGRKVSIPELELSVTDHYNVMVAIDKTLATTAWQAAMNPAAPAHYHVTARERHPVTQQAKFMHHVLTFGQHPSTSA